MMPPSAKFGVRWFTTTRKGSVFNSQRKKKSNSIWSDQIYEYFDEQEELLEQYLEIPIPTDFYKVQGNNIRMHERRAYIGFILQSGETPKHEFRGEIKPREFVTATYFYWEAMGIETGKGSSKVVAKFKNSMNNKNGWQKAKRMGTRGYKIK